MVLDGANRVTSLRELEFPHTVVQVVEVSNQHVNLQTWNHIVWGMDTNILVSSLRKVNGIELTKIDPLQSLDAPKYMPLQIRLSDGSFYILEEMPSDLATHINTLHQIVNTYKTRASIDRTSQTLVDFTKKDLS